LTAILDWPFSARLRILSRSELQNAKITDRKFHPPGAPNSS